LISWQQTILPAPATTLQYASLSFDVSFQEIFSTFNGGGTLVLLSGAMHDDSRSVLQVIAEEQIERLFVPFVALKHFAENVAGVSGGLAALQDIITAGEQLQITEPIRQWFADLESSTLHNHYGPSESHVVTAFSLTGHSRDWPTLPAIGRPISNIRIYVLDERLQPSPTGVIGELCIGGTGPARGYLNDSRLTAERFLPDAYCADPGRRLYRTGDLTRYRQNGVIDFLGRRDHQVKIRGFRIEPGEIETVLARHPHIREVVVVAQDIEATHGGRDKTQPADKRLVAYVVFVENTKPSVGDLRAFLGTQLPEYMVPQVFMTLDTLPLAPSGKIDRKALPSPDGSRPELARVFVAPRTPTEVKLAEIWQGVLGINRIGVHDGFFELGGHSLLATQVVSRMRDLFEFELPLRVLFESPTIAAIAERIDTSQRGLDAPPLVPVSRKGDLPLSFAQQRLWFFDQFAPGNVFYNMSAAIRANGPLDRRALQHAFQALVQRHEVLRTTFESIEGKPAQVVAPTSDVRLPVVDLRDITGNLRETEAKRAAVEESNAPFELARGPLLRVKLIHLAKNDHVMLLTMHHITSDGRSIQVLVHEVGSLYQSFSGGNPSELPALPIQYADFAVWQRQWLQGEVLEKQLSYWREQLAGSPPVLRLPARERPPEQTIPAGARESLRISADAQRAIKSLADETGATPFMVLLAAFKVLIHRYTGEEDLWVGTPIANRNRSEIENLIGFFVNTLILRTDLSHNPTFEEVLLRVRKTVLEAYTHQDLPYEELVAQLAPERRNHPGELAQTYFAFQGMNIGSAEFPDGLRLSPFEADLERPRGGIALLVTGGTEDTVASFVYSPAQFESKTIVEMAHHFLTILGTVTAHCEQTIATLPPFPQTAATRVRNLEGIYEHSNLTMNQLSVWLQQKSQPTVPPHNLAATIALHTSIDYDHFHKAFTTLVNSSDALRSVVEEHNGLPLRRVREPEDQPLEYRDVSDLENPREKMEGCVRRLSQTDLDLVVRPFHCALIKVSDTEYVWYLNLHPILFDGTSRTLMVRYMSDLYERSLTSQIPEMIDIPPFENFVAYEREYRLSQRYEESKAYWNAKFLRNIEPMTFYGKRPRKTSTQTWRFSFDVDRERGQRLQSVIRRPDISSKTANLTLFNVFASVVLAYLHHVSANRELWFASSFHNRRTQAMARSLGRFMELHPLCVLVEDHDTLVSLTRKVALEAAETLRHSEFSTEPVAPSTPDVFINLAGSNHRFDGSPVDLRLLGNQGHYAICATLEIRQPQSFGLHFEFHRDIFDATDCERAIGHFDRILDSLLENPEQRINRIQILSDDEGIRLLDELNRTDVDFPTDRTLPELFEAQTLRTPDRIALVGADQCLTYGELNANANRLALHLRGLGITPESRVGICMERSMELLLGILGILKAGGAYVPLDHGYPRERLAFMIADAGLSVLLTGSTLRQRCAALLTDGGLESGGRTPTVVCIDEAWSEISRQSKDNFACGLTADNAAYLIYTSGSTGRPKGVLTMHRGVINHNLAVSGQLELEADDRILQFHSIGFDTSVEEIFPTWLSGGTLVLRGEELPSAQALMELAVEQGLTVLDLPTAYWHTWVEEISNGSAQPAPSLRLVFVGGERAAAGQFEAWQRKANGVRWLNGYGPTEATVIATTFEPPPAFTTDNGIPIGRPIANARVYLLNGAMTPVPMAIAGELHIGGTGVARGYWNQPALTAERFLADPFAQGARLYKTGDIARYRQNGDIDFVGRADDQVKVRGFRIELGEIETVLKQHPAVREAVVLARAIQSGSQRSVDTELVGYLSCDVAKAPSTSDLRSFLQDKLPEYMVPQFFVTLDSFPLSPTGKVDRKALKDPERTKPESGKTFVAPRTAVEECIAGLWREVLQVGQVGVYDNFFELGGHSLLATQIVARIRKVFDVEVPLRELFESPTVARLAELIGRKPTTEFSSLVNIQAHGSLQPFFCVHPVQGTVFSYYNLSRHMGSNQPFYGLQAQGLPETPPVYRSIEAMAAHYIDRIQEIQPQGPYSLGGWSVGGVIAFEMAQQLERSGQRVASLILIDSYAPKDADETEPFADISSAVIFLERLGVAEEKIEDFRHLAFDAQVAFMLEQAQRAEVVPEEVTANQALLAWHIGNATAIYQPVAYHGRTLLLKASESPHSEEPTNGWSPYIGNQLDARRVPGTHFTMVEEPNIKVIASELANFLNGSEKATL